jgi:hypothetical protein
MHRAGIVGASLAITIAIAGSDPDPTGRWVGRMYGCESARTVVFDLTARDGRLTGTMIDATGERPISEGSFQGARISFAVVRELSGKPIKRIFQGEIGGDKMNLVSRAPNGKTPEAVCGSPFRRDFVFTRDRATAP